MTTAEFWTAINTIHRSGREAATKDESWAAIGLTEPEGAYFASRTAPLGRASAELATATLYGWSRNRIAQFLPRIWDIASPDQVLETRLEIARTGLGAVAGKGAEVGNLLAGALGGIELAGSPMAAAHISLPVPDDELGRLWHVATTLREYRADCHWSVLAAAGLNGAAANALALATQRQRPTVQQRTGWSDTEWDRAFATLRTRGWVDGENAATPDGIAAREQIEDATDRVTMAGLDTEATARLVSAEDGTQALHRMLSK